MPNAAELNDYSSPDLVSWQSIPRKAAPSSLTELAISSSNDARPLYTSLGRGLRLNTPFLANLRAETWTSSWKNVAMLSGEPSSFSTHTRHPNVSVGIVSADTVAPAAGRKMLAGA